MSCGFKDYERRLVWCRFSDETRARFFTLAEHVAQGRFLREAYAQAAVICGYAFRP